MKIKELCVGFAYAACAISAAAVTIFGNSNQTSQSSLIIIGVVAFAITVWACGPDLLDKI